MRRVLAAFDRALRRMTTKEEWRRYVYARRSKPNQDITRTDFGFDALWFEDSFPFFVKEFMDFRKS